MKNKFYPVIHVKSTQHAVENASLAWEYGADGVFLINMGDITPEVLLQSFLYIYDRTMHIRHEFMLGINFLTELNKLPINLPTTTMIWSDTLSGVEQMTKPYKFYAPYLFKYQPLLKKDNLSEVEKVADIITTSGDRTGHPPSLEKIQLIHQVAKKPIAIASGISADNITQFKPYVRDFLVGTSIGYHNLIPLEVERLAKIIHE